MYTFTEAKANTFILSLDNHVEIAAALEAFCREQDILAGTITGLGAISEATFRFLDPATKQYVDQTFSEQMEMTNLTGNISQKGGKPYLHLHITASRRDYTCIGGHLLTARINGACELVVEAFPGVWSGRRADPETGLNLYDFTLPKGVGKSLFQFVEREIIPQYAAFDKAHRQDHVRSVIARALGLAEFYPVRRDILYAAAAFHDLGMRAGRETHHLESGRIIRETAELRTWFSAEDIETIAQAAEDHRASAQQAPRSLYGRIIAEADRLIVPEQIVRRTVQYGLSHYPELPREGHWERTLAHLHEKYAEGGYLKLWIPESDNAAALEQLRALIRDEKALRALFERLYDEETR